MKPEQCRAARALLDMTRHELAERSGVALRTIANFEAGSRQPINATLQALRLALESAGVTFIAENGGGPGVRLVRPPS